ncbi:MAG: 4Fe-4S binding protein [Planctomycetota bacterium]
MTDLYNRLAGKLDELPNGYPATENGVELRILRKLFSEEDARMALELKPAPETAAVIARRLERPLDELESQLEGMADKGLIGCLKMHGKMVYMLMPFVIGIYEFQLDRLDKEFAELFAEYRPALMKTLGGTAPAVTRVIPVNIPIEAQHRILRHDDMHRMIEESNSFILRDCICRKQHALEGNSCKYPKDVCLGFSQEENAYNDFNYAGRVISKAEAFEVLELSEKEGLVHCTYNIEEGHRFICNCCICCCELLKGIKNQEIPFILAGSDWYAAIDAETCSACGTCADERCMMDAVVEENGAYKVMAERCIGCGVCTVTCPTGAIALKARPESERIAPPKNLVAWGMQRAENRRKA